MNAAPEFVDSHCHLDFEQFAGEESAALARAKEAGVGRVINVGTSLAGSRRSVELAERFGGVFAAVGVHPHDADKTDERTIEALHELAEHDKVVAIGETGFDFSRDGADGRRQSEAFLHHTAIATDRDLPLIIHSRDAEAETVRHLQRLREHWRRPDPGVVHCFTGTADFAKVLLKLDFLISFTAPVTYPKNDALREVVGEVPLEKMMVETDAPFLPPADRRGQRNEPALVVETARKIAELKGVSLDEVAQATTANAERLFGLGKRSG